MKNPNIDSENYYLYIGLALGVLLIPLCLIRKIEKFTIFHFIGDIALVATLFCLIYESVQKLDGNEINFNELKLISKGWPTLLGMGICSAEGIGLILPLKEKSSVKKSFNSIIVIGSSVLAMVIIGFPFVMYLCYQNETQEIILKNLDIQHKLYIQITLLLLIFSVLIVYPVTLYPSFLIINKAIMGNSSNKNLKYYVDTILRISIVIGTIALGIFSIGRFDTLLALVGSAACCPISLIFPTLFHFQIFKQEQSGIRSFFDLLIFVFGILLSLTVLVFTIFPM